MKTTVKIFGLIAMAALLFSCEKKLDNNVTPGDTPSQTPVENTELDPSIYLLGFGARFENETKATIDAADGTQAFENGDEVLVYCPATQASGTYQYDGTLFVPKTEGDAIAAGSNVIHVYYPATEFAAAGGDVTFTMPAAVEAGSAEDLGDKVPMAGILPAGSSADPVVTFKNLGSILRVIFKSSAAEGETITGVELSVTGANITGSGAVSWNGDTDQAVPSVAALDGTTSIKISTDDGHLTSGASKEFYFFLPASGTLSAMTIKAIYGKTGGFEPYQTVSRTSSMTLARNQIYKVQKTLSGFFSGGDGSSSYPYLISSADDFKAIATLANATAEADGNGFNATASRTFFGSTGVNYLQTAAIDFGNAALTPIGVYNATAADAIPFQGVYDGDSKTLSKFTVTGTQAASTGLFEYVDGATLKNIAIGTCSVTGENVTGILTGRCIGTTSIEGCTLSGGQVTGRNSVGFIAHVSGSTTVKNCTVSNITVVTAATGADANNQGGVVGYAGGASSIEGCSTSGTIQFTGTASGAARGGIVGKLDGTGQVKDCVNNAAVTNALVGSTGGIAGQLTNGTILSCANTGNVSGTSMVGGIVGFAGTTGEPSSICFITSCRTNADVSGTANCVAGIAGKLQNGVVMSGCYAEGNASTQTYDVAGLVGYIQASNSNAKARVYVYDCISNMNVSSSRGSGACRTGGAVGYVQTSAGQYVAVDNCGVLDVTITANGDYVGGFVGRLTGDGSNSNRTRIRNCYTLVNTVPGSSYKGGFVGSVENKAELRTDYFVADDSSDISSGTTKVDYTKKTAAEIQSNSTCTAFNANNFTLTVVETYQSARGWAMTNGYPIPGALIALGSDYYK